MTFDRTKWNREYYLKNKDKVLERHKKLVKCDECGASVGTYYLKKHKLSKKHLKVVNG